jgi:dehydrogenase/reductase SDR family protein 12
MFRFPLYGYGTADVKLGSTTFSRAVDTTLDRALLGYGNVGLAVRRRLPGWPADPPRIDGKVVLVTGAATGVGLAACTGFARLGASVHALGRNQRRAEQAVRRVLDAMPQANVHPAICDLSSLAAIQQFTATFVESNPRLDVLVHNAGTMPYEREYSLDGHELMFATHVLAPFALSEQLAPALERSAPSRVIFVSSGGMYSQQLPAPDFESEKTAYNPKKLYARTKREQVVLAELMAAQFEPRGIFVHSMHPGWVDTEGVRQYMPRFRSMTRPILRSPEEGADTIVWLGAAPEAVQSSGRFWHDRRPRPTHYLLGAGADSERDRRQLWRRCETLVSRGGSPTPTGANR